MAPATEPAAPAYHRLLRPGSVERAAADRVLRIDGIRATRLMFGTGDGTYDPTIYDDNGMLKGLSDPPHYPIDALESIFAAGRISAADACAAARTHQRTIASLCERFLFEVDRGGLAHVSNARFRAQSKRAAKSAEFLADYINNFWTQSVRRNPAEATRAAFMAAAYRRLTGALADGVLQYDAISSKIDRDDLIPRWSNYSGWDRQLYAWPEVSLTLLGLELETLACAEGWQGLPNSKRHVDPVRVAFFGALADVWHQVTGRPASAEKPKESAPPDYRSPFHAFIAGVWGHMTGVEYLRYLTVANGDTVLANKLAASQGPLGPVPTFRLVSQDLARSKKVA